MNKTYETSSSNVLYIKFVDITEMEVGIWAKYGVQFHKENNISNIVVCFSILYHIDHDAECATMQTTYEHNTKSFLPLSECQKSINKIHIRKWHGFNCNR